MHLLTLTITIFVLAALLTPLQSYAQASSDNASALTNEQNIQAYKSEADLWLDTVFGYCFAQTAGEPMPGYPSKRRGDWNKLRPDYASTLLKPLIDPLESAAPHAIILDVSEDGASCWTQFNSPYPQHIEAKFSAMLEGWKAEDRLKFAEVDDGYSVQTLPVVLVGEDRTPVIFYTAPSEVAGGIQIVIIVQKTVDGFVYYD